MEGTSTRMMYSPDAGDAAFAPNAKTEKKQTSKRRCIMASETIYAGREIGQVVAVTGDRGQPASPMPATAHLLRRGRGLPTPAVSGSMRSCHREPALPE